MGGRRRRRVTGLGKGLDGSREVGDGGSVVVGFLRDKDWTHDIVV